MKLFGRTGGYYLFWTGAVYFAVGMINIFVYPFCSAWLAQLVWITVLVVPLVIPQVGRYFNMNTMWETSMFGWRKRQIAEQVAQANSDLPDNGLFESKTTTDMPAVNEPAAEDAAFTIGITSDGRTQMRIKLDYGSATLTMTQLGVIDLIEDLAHTIRKDYEVLICPENQEDQVSE
jgi:Zn-dependent protease with chaperone function